MFSNEIHLELNRPIDVAEARRVADQIGFAWPADVNADLAGVSSISADGLTVLVNALNQAGARDQHVRLTGCRPLVDLLFAVTVGFDRHLAATSSAAAA